jgi:DNA-binding IclR family transcriptional regulator
MDGQTYSLFEAMGSRAAREGLDLLLALLEEPGSVEQLAARTGIASATASRRLDDLALVGLVSRDRPRGAYTATCPEPTRRFLEAASDLAKATLDERRKSEEQFRRRVRRTRLKTADAGVEGESELA